MFTDQQLYRAFFFYNPETGLLYRQLERNYPVGRLHSQGYLHFNFNGEMLLVHRIAWIYTHGDIPENLVMDHKNGIRSDNRLENLRLATFQNNGFNCKLNKSTRSGVKGVSFRKASNSWRARVNVNGKTVYEECFSSKIYAEIAVKKAREYYHGEFANHG